jgi:hypothetical protein
MNLRTLMQAGPTKANELFAKLGETSDGAVKTREKLFAELKTELELHATSRSNIFFPSSGGIQKQRNLLARRSRTIKIFVRNSAILRRYRRMTRPSPSN